MLQVGRMDGESGDISFVKEDIDIECWNLVRVMNMIPGIVTTSCCCGHGEDAFRVYFVLDKSHYRGMNLIARSTCPRYRSFAKNELRADCVWNVHLHHGDLPYHQAGYVLESKFTKPEDEEELIFDRFDGLDKIEAEMYLSGARSFIPAEKLAWDLENHLLNKINGYNILYDRFD